MIVTLSLLLKRLLSDQKTKVAVEIKIIQVTQGKGIDSTGFTYKMICHFYLIDDYLHVRCSLQSTLSLINQILEGLFILRFTQSSRQFIEVKK